MTDLEATNRLRGAYVMQRRRLMPEYNGGKTLENALPRILASWKRTTVSPEEYMKILSLKMSGRFDEFWPNMAYGHYAETSVNSYAQAHDVATPGELWMSQLGKLRQALDNTKRSAEDILADHAMPFTAWFRVVITKQPVPKVMEKYHEVAKQQLRDKELLEFLKTKTPEQIKRLL